MPIEDIDYLYEKGSKENKVIFVDSSTRDMVTYPTPSEYIVEFTEPFTNVFGVEILDAAIPRTMYNIDVDNNKVVFAMGPRASSDILSAPTTNYVPALDYGSSELATKLSDVISTNGCSMSVVAIGTSVMTFSSSMPFAFDMEKSTTGESLGFSMVPSSNNFKDTKVNTSTSSPNYRMIRVPDRPSAMIYASVSVQVSNSDGVMIAAVPYAASPYSPSTMTAATVVSSSAPITANSQVGQRLRVASTASTASMSPSTSTTYMRLTSLQVQLILRNVVYTAIPLITWSVYTSKPTSALRQTPMYTGALVYDSVSMTASTTALSSVYLLPDTDYWVVFQDTANITPSTSACFGIPYASKVATGTDVQIVTTTNGGVVWTDLDQRYAICMYTTAEPSVFEIDGAFPSLTEVFGSYYVAPSVINSVPLTTNSWFAQPLIIDKTTYSYATLQTLEFQVMAKTSATISPSLTWGIYTTAESANVPGSTLLYGGPLTLTQSAPLTQPTLYIASAAPAAVILSANTLYWIVVKEAHITSSTQCMAMQYNTTTNLRTYDYTGICNTWNGVMWNELSVSTTSSPRYACMTISWALTSLASASSSDAAAATAALATTAAAYPIGPDTRVIGGNIKPLTANHWVAQFIEMPVKPTCLTLRTITVQLAQIGSDPSTMASARLKWSIYLSSTSGSHPISPVFSGTLTVDAATMIGTSGDLSLDEDALVVLRNDQTELYWLVIEDDSGNVDSSQCMAITYMPGGAPDTSNNYRGLATDNRGSTWYKACFNYCANITYTHKTFSLTPPGFLSLVGDRFIILRCPEIERNIFGSMAFGNNSPGIALFKMGCVGYSDSRFDFSTVEYKEFHPIGKLPRLTFRFERINGDLYNFKTVNHHLMIVVKHYVARKQGALTMSTLNPNYNPNFLKYKRYMEEHETSSVEDEERHVDGRTFRNVYLKKEAALRSQFDDAEDDEDAEDEAGSDDDMTHGVRYVGNVYRKPYRDTGPYQDSSSEEEP